MRKSKMRRLKNDLQATEAYRLLRTNLLYLAIDRPRAIMVTSALPQEGKTTVAANLARVCCDGGTRVLLVDGNLRRPALHKFFALDNSFGLTQALEEERHVVVQQAEPGLDLLTSGSLPDNPPDILASESMMELITFVKEKYELIIFDSPPVLSVSDTIILAKRVDGILLVVKWSATRRDHAAEAIKCLARANQNILGVVLNSVNNSKQFGRQFISFEPAVVNELAPAEAATASEASAQDAFSQAAV